MFEDSSAADLLVLIREENCLLLNQPHVSHFTVAWLVIQGAFERTGGSEDFRLLSVPLQDEDIICADRFLTSAVEMSLCSRERKKHVFPYIMRGEQTLRARAVRI